MTSGYSHILDPITQTHSSVRSNEGRSVLKSYLQNYLKSTQSGGVFESFVHREIVLNDEEGTIATETIKAYKTPFQKKVQTGKLDQYKLEEEKLQNMSQKLKKTLQKALTPNSQLTQKQQKKIKKLFKNEYGIVQVTFPDKTGQTQFVIVKTFRVGWLNKKSNQLVKSRLESLGQSPNTKKNTLLSFKTSFFAYDVYTETTETKKQSTASKYSNLSIGIPGTSNADSDSLVRSGQHVRYTKIDTTTDSIQTQIEKYLQNYISRSLQKQLVLKILRQAHGWITSNLSSFLTVINYTFEGPHLILFGTLFNDPASNQDNTEYFKNIQDLNDEETSDLIKDVSKQLAIRGGTVFETQ